jgi:glutamine cyclotransferase
MLNKNLSYCILIFVLFGISCSDNPSNKNEQTEQNVIPAPNNLSYEVIKVYPHDTTSYTQGLEWNNNSLIEGTGNYEKSKLHMLDSNMKQIGKENKLDKTDFGEGITLFNGKIYQLTWKEHKVIVYDAATLSKIKELYWPYEGWGLTHNDSSLIVSTGESNIYFVNPENFTVTKTVGVFNNYGYVSNINELEYVNDKIYANIYLTDNIIQIDPKTGQVQGIADMSNLLAKVGVANNPRNKDAGNVLNGIAYHKKRSTFFVTGKDWPVMVELKFK